MAWHLFDLSHIRDNEYNTDHLFTRAPLLSYQTEKRDTGIRRLRSQRRQRKKERMKVLKIIL